MWGNAGEWQLIVCLLRCCDAHRKSASWITSTIRNILLCDSVNIDLKAIAMMRCMRNPNRASLGLEVRVKACKLTYYCHHVRGCGTPTSRVGEKYKQIEKVEPTLMLHLSPLCRNSLLISSIHNFENEHWMNMSCIYGALINDAPPWQSAP